MYERRFFRLVVRLNMDIYIERGRGGSRAGS